MSQFDAIIVPGGGVRHGGDLPVWIERRLDRAIELHGDALVMVLSAGTPYVAPPLDVRGFPIFESVAAANYLVSHGVAPDRILIETASYDTIGNAYFSRVIHAEPRRLRSLLVITSAFHMERTEVAFRWIYGLGPTTVEYQLQFEATSDEGILAAALAARQAKERDSLRALNDLAVRVRTLSDLHEWLFARHGVYAAGKREQRRLDENLHLTY